MSNVNKMDTSAVFEMFESINKKLDKHAGNTVEPSEVDMTAIDALTEQLENVIEEVRKPAKVEHQQRHNHRSPTHRRAAKRNA